MGFLAFEVGLEPTTLWLTGVPRPPEFLYFQRLTRSRTALLERGDELMFLHGSNAGNGNTGVVAFANYGLILEMPMSLASTGEVIVTILGSKLPA